MEEEEDLGGIGISLGEGQKIEIVVSYVKVLATVSTGYVEPPTTVDSAA